MQWDMPEFKFTEGQVVLGMIGGEWECVKIVKRQMIYGRPYYGSDMWSRLIPESYFKAYPRPSNSILDNFKLSFE